MITTRPAVEADLPRLLEIERAAMPGLQYLEGVFELFLRREDGELVAALQDGVLGGFGRLSLLCDGSAWLETLRVDPALQRRGLGAAIWARYLELCRQFQVPAVRMYTGEQNVASAKLAERNGLALAVRSVEGNLPLANLPEDAADAPPPFQPISDPDELAALWEQHRSNRPRYLCLNRTFYAMGAPLDRELCRTGRAYRLGDTLLILGARFLPERALHIGWAAGDLGQALAFAIARGRALGVPKLTWMLPDDRTETVAWLRAHGFVFSSRILLLERRFDS